MTMNSLWGGYDEVIEITYRVMDHSVEALASPANFRVKKAPRIAPADGIFLLPSFRVNITLLSRSFQDHMVVQSDW